MFAQQGNGWCLCFADGVEGTWQDDGSGACVCQGLDAILIKIFDMVSRQCAVACGKLSTAKVGQLFSVQFDRQAKFDSHIKHSCDLGCIKCNAFTEPVDDINQPFSVSGT